MFTILNRLRGTRAYFAIAVLLGILVYAISNDFMVGIGVALAYLICEAFGLASGQAH
jgi:hypothetical protein